MQLNLLMQISVQQDYLPKVYTIIPLNNMGNAEDGEKSHLTAKNLLISLTRKKNH